ncbi:hypothetical protein L6164_033066 [Bauhinia variegata]|uniref:Uncharacterized protein n=1 Tax=Bauhinia variegata TaxID=167791 RepID=A0ACB9KQZ8_BAUVA|nr:hypothetical protein L6164_033066 [Bauhinia variegata]
MVRKKSVKLVEKEEEDREKEKETPLSSPSQTTSSSDGREYEVEDLSDRLDSSRRSRFNLIENELTRRKFSSQAVLDGIRVFSSEDSVIHPDNRSSLFL